MESCCVLKEDKIHLAVKAVPGSSKNQIGAVKEGRLKIKIAAPPEDGKANEEIRAFLAKLLGCPKKEVVLLSGEKSRLKTIALPLAAGEKLKEIIDKAREAD